MDTVTTSAPAKAILFGEHAVNRGQAAIAVSVGLRTRCTVRTGGYVVHFESAGHARTFTRDEVVALGEQVDVWREAQTYQAIREMAASDFYAPAKYIIAHAMRAHDMLSDGLDIAYQSEIPNSGGLGSGGAAGVALATALQQLASNSEPSHGDDRKSKIQNLKSEIGRWAYLGDVIAHGGVASALDTQTSLHGGVIRYTKEAWGERIPAAASLQLVIGDTGVRGQTSEVNTRVREWLATDATRMRHFDMIGVLSADAQKGLESGDWRLLGKLMNINQLVLEKIGVSCPELERLIDAAIGAGALGAKLSGSGGGGIMIALVSDGTRDGVVAALHAAGARAVYTPAVAVEGARVEA
jgi:mevalonate kinase